MVRPILLWHTTVMIAEKGATAVIEDGQAGARPA